jgi:hypothetical protein
VFGSKGQAFNPSSLNQWLDGHGGYESGDLLVWGSVNVLGVSFQGMELPGQCLWCCGEVKKRTHTPVHPRSH